MNTPFARSRQVGPQGTREGSDKNMKINDWVRRDDGNISLLVLVLAVAVLVMIGLSVDGGGKLRALGRADDIAAEAARAGGQAIAAPPAIEGGPKTLDPDAAVAAAQAYLAAAGVTGSVTVAADRHHLTVTVHIVYRTIFLGAVGITELPITRTATAVLVVG